MKNERLINKIDDNAVEMARLAILLEAQSDELISIDDSSAKLTLENWKHHRNEMQLINNIVMRHLQQMSNKSTSLVDNYYSHSDK